MLAGWQSGRSAHGLHRARASQESTSLIRENMTFESLRSKGGFLYIRVLEVPAGLPDLKFLLLHAMAPHCLRFRIQCI